MPPTMDSRGQMTGLLSPFLEWLRLRVARPFIGPRDRVLDIGCGRARLLEEIQVGDYVGLDILDKVIAYNRHHHPGLRFEVLNITTEPLPDDLGRFDVVVMLAVLEHLPEPAAALRALKARLNDGGRIVLTTPHPIGELVLAVGARLGIFSAEGEDEHQPLMGERALRAIARDAGMQVQTYRRFLLGFNQIMVLRS